MQKPIRNLTRVFSVFFLLALLCFSTHPALAQEYNPNPPDAPVRLIFIHHSTGENWLMDDYGGLGRALDANNYYVSDTNYGWGPDSIGDRTDIVDWPEWFGPQRNENALRALYAEDGQHSSYTRTLSNPGGENEIILFKSCFPNSNLEGNPDDPPTPGEFSYTVGSAKYIYNLLLDYFITRPDKMFVVITAPPVSDPSLAENARAFNNWLVYEWLQDYGGSNVFVFDFYNVLTSPDAHHDFHEGQIRHTVQQGWNTTYYPSDGGDDHPNREGSLKATEEFVPLLNIYYHLWQENRGYPFPENAEAGAGNQPETGTGMETGAQQIAPGTVIEDFENNPRPWEAYPDEQGSALLCEVDTQSGSSGNASLRITYTLVSGGWGDCVMNFESSQDWSQASGITFFVRATHPNPGLTLRLRVGDENVSAPFEAVVEIPQNAEEWVQVFIPFEELQRASWVEENAISEFDPTRILDMNFNVWENGDLGESTVWIDEIRLAGSTETTVVEEEQPAVIQEESGETSSQDEGGFLRSFCPLSTAGFPLAALTMLFFARRYKR